MKKNNGGIALKLLTDSSNSLYRSSKLKSSVPKKVDVLIKNILDKFDRYEDKINAIIDAGAFFKTLQTEKLPRRCLMLEDRIKVVLYYDERSNQLEFVKKLGKRLTQDILLVLIQIQSKISHTEVENRFTFYDHRHITGSDIIQAKNAHAILTIGTRIFA